MHDEIIRYSMAGELPDANIVQAKERMTKFLENQMRDNGCAPVLDLIPQFTVDYQAGKGTFKFELTVYGVFVGREAWATTGMTNGTTITNSTQRNKSKES
jgi:hypothetical protein